ncbi:hypothetical protein Salat_0610600 [Sesamum alatum]|uniref:Retroviral polymerase SH3-like domain-containing protein n=1 Tax=Sesamum alatum TaxID=300844 RepID=A0AAE2CU20_9LAMI|nr:hypothetical protein Salat_0610600 [Sesamum alatum]
MNRSHTKSVHGKTPQKAWSGYKPTITHLRIFGSIAYTHVPDQKRIKLDDKSARYVFIGYYQSSKGYKLYNPSSGKFVISCDVEFDEEGVWEWNDQNKNDHYNPFVDDDEEDMVQPITPPSTPPPQNIQTDEASSSEGPRGFRSLRELYDVTEESNPNNGPFPATSSDDVHRREVTGNLGAANFNEMGFDGEKERRPLPLPLPLAEVFYSILSEPEWWGKGSARAYGVCSKM